MKKLSFIFSITLLSLITSFGQSETLVVNQFNDGLRVIQVQVAKRSTWNKIQGNYEYASDSKPDGLLEEVFVKSSNSGLFYQDAQYGGVYPLSTDTSECYFRDGMKPVVAKINQEVVSYGYSIKCLMPLGANLNRAMVAYRVPVTICIPKGKKRWKYLTTEVNILLAV